MTMMGSKWQSMTDEEKEPFLQMARDESKQYDKERALMEKAQKPNSVWQPLRRCRMVLERLAKDSFADIFLEPVDPEDFPDYEEVIDAPMDIGTVQSSNPKSTKRQSSLHATCEKSGITARFTISMVPLFGTSLTTCPSSSNACIMRGYWSFVSDIYDGETRELDRGSTRVECMMVNADVLPTRLFSVTTVMPCMASSASIHP